MVKCNRAVAQMASQKSYSPSPGIESLEGDGSRDFLSRLLCTPMIGMKQRTWWRNKQEEVRLDMLVVVVCLMAASVGIIGKNYFGS